MRSFEATLVQIVNARAVLTLMTVIGKIRRARNFSRVLSRADAFRVVFTGASAAARAYAAPALGAAIYLRPGTIDLDVFEKIFLHGDYELPFPVAPQRIIDGGAHIGLASRYFAHRYPTARIVAVEPIEANLAVLRQNTEACPQIEVRAAAVWGRATALASMGDSSWSHTMRETPGESPTIRSVTIPEILADARWDRVDVLKLDVEGAEREIFSESAAEWLPRVRLIVIELHDRFQAGCSHAFYRRIADRLEAQEVRGENVFALLRGT